MNAVFGARGFSGFVNCGTMEPLLDDIWEIVHGKLESDFERAALLWAVPDARRALLPRTFKKPYKDRKRRAFFRALAKGCNVCGKTSPGCFAEKKLCWCPDCHAVHGPMEYVSDARRKYGLQGLDMSKVSGLKVNDRTFTPYGGPAVLLFPSQLKVLGNQWAEVKTREKGKEKRLALLNTPEMLNVRRRSVVKLMAYPNV